MSLENQFLVEYEAHFVWDRKISFLFTKKVEKLWKSVVISLMVSIDLIGTRYSTELTALQSFPASFSFSRM